MTTRHRIIPAAAVALALAAGAAPAAARYELPGRGPKSGRPRRHAAARPGQRPQRSAGDRRDGQPRKQRL